MDPLEPLQPLSSWEHNNTIPRVERAGERPEDRPGQRRQQPREDRGDDDAVVVELHDSVDESESDQQPPDDEGTGHIDIEA